MSEPVRAGGTHGLGFFYQDGAEGSGALVFRGPAGFPGPIR